jgi:two-component system response regulator HydG
VLIVDDDEGMCDLIGAELSARGFEPSLGTDPAGVLEALESRELSVDVVVTDLRMLGMNGLELCERIVATQPDLPVVVLTAFGNLEAAVAALRVRAFDFLTKPPDFNALAAALERAVLHGRLAEEVRALDDGDVKPLEPLEGIIGSSPPMRELVQLVGRIATIDASVLIRGESGAGKELVARALHERSRRRSGPFVALNCAAIPETMLEAELFGHVKGAFTDARADHPGLFERASGGTLFLDEIAELHLPVQPKLLRALQERSIRPVGSSREVQVDVRLVTATNADLAAAVERRAFRADLFYRLNVIDVVVPPLRERGRDVLLLAQHFVRRFAAATGRDVVGLKASCAAALMAHSWPGNVRELANTIERAVALTTFTRLSVEDLPATLRAVEPRSGAKLAVRSGEFPSLDEVERRYIRRVMQATGGNKTLAARILGVDRRTLYRKNWADDAPEAKEKVS